MYADTPGPSYCPVGLGDWCHHGDTPVTLFAATPKSLTQEFCVFSYKNVHGTVADLLIAWYSYFGGSCAASNSPSHCQTS